MGKSVMTNPIGNNQKVSGNPAIPHRENLKYHAFLMRWLPSIKQLGKYG